MNDWLIDTFMVTSILMVVILLVRGPVARLFGPTIAYGLWLLPAARLFMPVIEVEETAQAVAVPVNSPIPDTIRDNILANIQGGGVAETPALLSVDYGILILSVWLGGAALLFLVQMMRYVAMRDETLSNAVNIGSVDGISLIQTDNVTGPLAFGLFRRYIAVPPNFTSMFSPREAELALDHEVAHHRSGDLLANLAAFIILCLNWFNPVAWVSWHAFRFDQEAACDARILDGKDGEQRQVYGRALARSAQDGLPTFATALNSPKTIIARLRRLNMNDISKKRRIMGKAGIFGAIAVILPLTATTATIASQNEWTEAPQAPDAPATPETAQAPDAPHIIKIIKVEKQDGEDIDEADLSVHRFERDGKIFEFKTNRELSEKEIEKHMATAEKRHMIFVGKSEDGSNVKHKNIIRVRKKHDGKEGGDEDISWVMDGDTINNMIPEIDIIELSDTDCPDGQPVTTDVSGSDGKDKARIKLVMCGKGSAKLARAEAAAGLREALAEIQAEEDIPDSIRKDIIEKLNKQLKKMEKDTG